ncbi:MAG: YqaJ viral recombinase family protein, partial [Candidatus Thiodiazotropha sp.]
MLKIRSLELNNETGKLGYRSHNFNIVPRDVKNRGQTIVAEHSPWEISVHLVQKNEHDIFEETISSPLSKKVRKNTHGSTTDFKSNESSSGPAVAVASSGYSKADVNMNNEEEMQSLISIMSPVVDYLKSAGKLEIWKKFNFLLASHKFPLDNIAFLLFLDVVRWFDCDTSVTMRYEPVVKKFWRIGYKLFHGKWLRFMSGPKNKGEIVKSSTKRGLFDPRNSKINFAVPYQKIRDSTEGPVSACDIKPGILSYLLDKYAEQASKIQTFKLCFDGKKINAAIKGEQGDIDLFGFDGPPNIGERRQRLEDEKNLMQTAADMFTEQTIKLKENVEQMSDEDKNSAVFQLRNVVHVLSLRLKELREAKVSREMAVAKFKKMAGADWRKSKFLHVISGLETVLHDINVTVSNILAAVNKLGIVISHLSNDLSFTTERQVTLRNQGNYVHLAEKVLPADYDSELRYLKQRSEKWFAKRKTAAVTGSTLYKAVGLESLKAQLQHFDNVVYQKEKEEPSAEVKQRMEHGSLNEINGVATIVGKVLPMFYPSLHFFEEGCYENAENGCKMIISPDGSIRDRDTDAVILGVEIKCPAPKPLPVFRPIVHYDLPKYYIPQVLAEMAVLGTDRLLYVCYTEESTTVHLVEFSQSIWDKICDEVKSIYGKENPKRPTKRSSHVAKLLTDIEEFKKTNVTFLCEVQSSKGLECREMISDLHGKLCFHINPGTSEETLNIRTVQTWLYECLTCLESSYQLTRNRASEFLGFMISDLDRLYKEEELHAVPIAYGLKGYSLSTQTLRAMMEYVLFECHKRGLYVPVCSCDGQWHRVAVRDRHDNPLTLLQLQKDIWKYVRSLDKGVIMNEIGDLNIVPQVESFVELNQYIDIEIMDSGAIVVNCLKERKKLNVSQNVIALIVNENKNKVKKKRQKSSTPEDSVSNDITDNVTNDLLSSLQQNHKEVSEEVENQILEIVSGITNQTQSLSSANIPCDKILETSSLDDLFSETSLENHVAIDKEIESLSPETETQTQ